jgi:hypothetical protein
MIRKMLGLAWEAAKVEVTRRKTPLLEPAVETVPAINEAVEVSVTSAVRTPEWRRTSGGLSAALDATTCPDCDAPKATGWFQCASCRPKKAAS